jgi:hypothetical protein
MELAVINLLMYNCYYSYRPGSRGRVLRLLRDLGRLDRLVCSEPLPLVRGLAHAARGVG